jgi:hypothetical protein
MEYNMSFDLMAMGAQTNPGEAVAVYEKLINALEKNGDPEKIVNLTNRIMDLQKTLIKSFRQLSPANQEQFIAQRGRFNAVLLDLVERPKAAPAAAKPEPSAITPQVAKAKAKLDREINLLRQILTDLKKPTNANKVLSGFKLYMTRIPKIGSEITALGAVGSNGKLLKDTYDVLQELHNEVLAKIKDVKPLVVRPPVPKPSALIEKAPAEELPVTPLLPPKPLAPAAKVEFKFFENLMAQGSKVKSYTQDRFQKLGSSVYRFVGNQYGGGKGLMRGAVDLGIAATIYNTSGHLDNPWVASTTAVLVPTLLYARKKLGNDSGKKQASVPSQPASAAVPSPSTAPVQLDAALTEQTQARAPHRFNGFDISALSKKAPVATDPKPPEFVGVKHRFGNAQWTSIQQQVPAPAPAPIPQAAAPVQYVAVDEPPSPVGVDHSFDALIMMQEGAQPLGSFKWGNRAVQIDLAHVDLVEPPKKLGVLGRVVNALFRKKKTVQINPVPVVVPASPKDTIVLEQNKPAPKYTGFRDFATKTKAQLLDNEERLFHTPEDHKEKLEVDVNRVRLPAELDLHNLDAASDSDDEKVSVASESNPLQAKLEPESDDEKTYEID